MVKFALKLGVFLTIIVLVGAVMFATAGGLWIMFITWVLNAEFDRLIIIATSGFWIGAGGISWAILRSRKNSNVK